MTTFTQTTYQTGHSANKILFIVLLLLLLLTGVWVGGYMSGIKNTPAKTVEKKIVVTATPTSIATTSAMIATNPNVTPTGTATTLSYMIPPGFSSIESSDGSFRFSYDPKRFKAKSENGNIYFNYTDSIGSLAYVFSPKAYDGGSRHAFIQQYSGNDFKTEKTVEKNYNMNGQSALVMYNVDYSATHTLV